MAKKVQGKKLVWVIGNAECSQWYQIDPNLEPIRYHSERLDVPYSPNQFLAMDFFCRFLQQYCSTTFFFMEIFQNEICWLQRKNKYNKYVLWKIKIYCSQPWIRYAIYAMRLNPRGDLRVHVWVAGPGWIFTGFLWIATNWNWTTHSFTLPSTPWTFMMDFVQKITQCCEFKVAHQFQLGNFVLSFCEETSDVLILQFEVSLISSWCKNLNIFGKKIKQIMKQECQNWL